MCTTKTVTFFSFRTHTAILHPVSIFQRNPVSDEPETDVDLLRRSFAVRFSRS
jgi:hypothetical protein